MGTSMQIVLTWDSIIKAAAVLGATGVLIGTVVKFVHWMDRQKQQDNDISALRTLHNADMDAMKQEQSLVVYGLLACLKGLKEQGCNGPVTEAINRLEKHLNEKAHE